VLLASQVYTQWDTSPCIFEGKAALRMYYPPSQPPLQPVPKRHLSPFWRNFLIALAVVAVLGCVLSTIGFAVGLRTGFLSLPNGMRIAGLTPAPDGYMGQDSSGIIFITFNSPPQNGAVSGAIYFTGRVVVGGNIQNIQRAWTGTQSGGGISIILTPVNGYAQSTWQATWQGSNLVVT
jgi:hypothetical protein